MRLASGVGLGTEVGSGGARLGKVAREDWLKERSEDDLGTTTQLLVHGVEHYGTVGLTQSGEGTSKG
jgi:hypothetical protein